MSPGRIRALKNVSHNIFTYLIGESTLACVLPRLADLRLAVGVEFEVPRTMINVGGGLDRSCSWSLRFLGLLAGDKVGTVGAEASGGLSIVETTHFRHVSSI